MRIILSFIFLIVSLSANAHKSSDSYINLVVDDSVSLLNWEIALQDLVLVVDLDIDKDGKISWGEIKENKDELFANVFSQLDVSSADKYCRPEFKRVKLSQHSDGVYLYMSTQLSCDLAESAFEMEYHFLFDQDAQHRGLLNFTSKDISLTHVFSPDDNKFYFQNNDESMLRSFSSFFREGVWHIWVGYDHVLFLISLLLPVVLVRKQNSWQCADKVKPVVVSTLKVVTAFTIAHSITLSLVSLGVIELPIALAESFIAMSVVVAAGINLLPGIPAFRWQLGFIFGLIHGFGFASVLSELNASNESLLFSLLGFNLGVEAGQFAIVLLLVPLLFYFRQHRNYELVVLKTGSAIVMMLGLIWAVQRSF